MSSPCLKCENKDKSKDTIICMYCKKRIQYAIEEGLMSPEAQDGSMGDRSLVKGLSSVIIPEPPIKKHRGRKPGSKNKPKGVIIPQGQKLEPPKELKHEVQQVEQPIKKDTNTLDMEITFHGSFAEDSKLILDEARRIARIELRNINAQLLYFIREGVNRWNEENKK